MDSFVIRFIEWGGYYGIALLMALENVFPPIPSELIMGIGGISVSRGAMDILPLMIAGTVGATLGNYVLFLAGDRLGYERLRPLVDRHGRWLTMEWEDVEKAGHYFRRHGRWVVFALRFMPLLRTIVSIPAGLAHMSHLQFLVYTAAGAAIWNFALVKAGEWLGTRFAEAETWLSWATVALAVVALGWYVWRVSTWKPRDER